MRFLFPFRKKEEKEETSGHTSQTHNDSDTLPKQIAKVNINGVGSFRLNLTDIQTKRSDLFCSGQYSVFDIITGLADNGSIDVRYHFDESLNTYVIESINGKQTWWYTAYYDGGWPERNVFRMDHFPYKDGMQITLTQVPGTAVKEIYQYFQAETKRKQNSRNLVVPEVLIRGQHTKLKFNHVEVRPHNLRNDLFHENVPTALDVILSLADEGKLTYELKWHESLGRARTVKSYWVEKINNEQSYRSFGFVYEEGSYEYRHGRGNHIHIPADARIIHSPEYVEWFWICL
ncbi:MAG: hypothetical protein SCK29_06230 [Bacillota bacterium]|nr:hypothetical protein [Bacillota bacterium]